MLVPNGDVDLFPITDHVAYLFEKDTQTHTRLLSRQVCGQSLCPSVHVKAPPLADAAQPPPDVCAAPRNTEVDFFRLWRRAPQLHVWTHFEEQFHTWLVVTRAKAFLLPLCSQDTRKANSPLFLRTQEGFEGLSHGFDSLSCVGFGYSFFNPIPCRNCFASYALRQMLFVPG